MAKHARPISPDGETDGSFARELAEVQAMQDSEDAAPQSHGYPRELADWLLNYIDVRHPGVMEEALRARGEETARRSARKIQAGTVVTTDLNGERWRVERRYSEDHRDMVDAEAPDGTLGRFYVQELTVDSDQSWPLDLSAGSDSGRPYSAQS